METIKYIVAYVIENIDTNELKEKLIETLIAVIIGTIFVLLYEYYKKTKYQRLFTWAIKYGLMSRSDMTEIARGNKIAVHRNLRILCNSTALLREQEEFVCPYCGKRMLVAEGIEQKEYSKSRVRILEYFLKLVTLNKNVTLFTDRKNFLSRACLSCSDRRARIEKNKKYIYYVLYALIAIWICYGFYDEGDSLLKTALMAFLLPALFI